MNIAYKGYEKTGKNVAGTIEAGSAAEARELLVAKGLFVTEMGSEDSGARGAEGAGNGKRTRRGGGRGRRLRDMTGFMRQLSVLVGTGAPVVEAITSLERQLAPGPWRATIVSVRKRLEDGYSLSASMEPHPEYFDAVARSLVAAGESSGKLDAMLQRVGALARQQIKIRASIVGAMVYPAVLMTVASIVLSVMIGFVLPRFKGLFESLSAPLPPTTRMLMSVGDFMRSYWWGVVPAVIGAIAGVVWWLGTPQGKVTVQRLAVRLPKFGDVTRSFVVARVVRIMGVLLEGKVPLLEALELTSASSGNVCYAALLDKAHAAVMRGENISTVFSQSPLVPNSVTEAVRSGERTGQMAPVLLHMADYLDEDNEIVLRSLTSIVEPLILLVLGVVIGFVAMSMFLPLFDLTSATQAGPGGGAGSGGGN